MSITSRRTLPRPDHCRVAGLFALALTLAVTAVAGARADDASHPQASRVVTIGGSLTEIVYALGEENRLAGRDSTSVYPPAALALPDVGYIRALSAEGVLSIKPDLIIALEGAGPPETVGVLESAGVPFVSVPESFDADGIADKVRRVGVALGVEEKAKTLEQKIRSDLADAEQATGERKEQHKVMFILSMQGGRILASGRGTAANGIITMAGAKNAFADFEGYKQLNDEAVIAAAPDIILMMDRGGDQHLGKNDLLAHPAIVATPAAKTGHVVRMDGTFLLGFGPRTAQAVRELVQAFDGPPLLQ